MLNGLVDANAIYPARGGSEEFGLICGVKIDRIANPAGIVFLCCLHSTAKRRIEYEEEEKRRESYPM
jgi:hypothetical protein